MKNEQIKIEYYSEHNDLYVACVNNGYGGMFVFRKWEEHPKWEFVHPGSVAWDSFHQEIYRNYRLVPCSAAVIAMLPPLPEIPDFTFIEWHENFLPKDPLRSNQYPNTSRLLRKMTNKSHVIFIILFEDRYETMFGDGKFLFYHHKIFLTEKEAGAFVSEHGDNYYVRSLTIRLQEGVLVSDDFRPEQYEHYKLEEILNDLEKILQK